MNLHDHLTLSLSLTLLTLQLHELDAWTLSSWLNSCCLILCENYLKKTFANLSLSGWSSWESHNCQRSNPNSFIERIDMIKFPDEKRIFKGLGFSIWWISFFILEINLHYRGKFLIDISDWGFINLSMVKSSACRALNYQHSIRGLCCQNRIVFKWNHSDD